MPIRIASPTRIEAAGNKPKIIDEYVGRVNSGTGQVSVARMRSPAGWQEPGQTPEFDEYTVVLRGTLNRRLLLLTACGDCQCHRHGGKVRRFHVLDLERESP